MSKLKKGRGVNVENIRPRGFFRLQIRNQDGKVAGDSGWKENTVVNLGFDQYLCQGLAGMAGSKTISYAMLGSCTAPGATGTSLEGEYTDVATARCAVTPTTIASKTVQFAFTLASSVYTSAKTIQNVGLINHSSTATLGTIFAGNTLTKSMRLIAVMLYEKLAICWKLLRGVDRKVEHKRTISREGSETRTLNDYTPIPSIKILGEDIVWSAWRHAEVGRNDQSSEMSNKNSHDTTSALATNQSVNGLLQNVMAPLSSNWHRTSLKLQGQLNKLKSICSEILDNIKKTFNDYNREFQLA